MIGVELVPYLVVGGGLIALAGQCDNHGWRLIVLGVMRLFGNAFVSSMQSILVSDSHNDLSPVVTTILWILISIGIWWVPHLQSFSKRQGCVFITGADSGMGQATVLHLAKTNTTPGNQYATIFAGCYNAKQALESFGKLLDGNKELLDFIQVVPLDVTSETSIATATKQVQTFLTAKNSFLIGLIQFHGVAYNGPVAYMPIEMYTKQLDVNYLGYIRMIQHMLPLLQEGSSKIATKAIPKPGRIVCTGTGGGPCSPCPPLLSAYMSSKFAGEAFLHSLRMELFMNDIPIECSVINPGFVKPTMLMAEGLKLTTSMWKACEDKLGGSTKAKDEYGPMMTHFLKYSELQPGTHVSVVAHAAEHALTSGSPRTSYKVGIDSKLAPIVGMMPTGAREWIARNGIYGVLSPAGTIQGYKV